MNPKCKYCAEGHKPWWDVFWMHTINNVNIDCEGEYPEPLRPDGSSPVEEYAGDLFDRESCNPPVETLEEIKKQNENLRARLAETEQYETMALKKVIQLEEQLLEYQAHESERKTVHEWLNDLKITRTEQDKEICLLRRLRILCDSYFTYQTLYGASFGMIFNANDTFGYACADAHTVETTGLIIAEKILGRYGHDGITAIMAYERGYEPLEELRNDNYKQARKAIDEILEEWKTGQFKLLYENYMKDLEEKRKKNEW